MSRWRGGRPASSKTETASTSASASRPWSPIISNPGPKFSCTRKTGFGVGRRAPEGKKDPDLVNASKEAVTYVRGASFFSQADAHVMVRGGHLNASILGAYQVSEKGNLANWMLPGSPIGRVGGAMDLAAGARRVIALMTHVTKEGKPKIVRECSYPLTGKACVDLIITDLAVVQVNEDGLHLLEVAPGWSAQEIQQNTEPRLTVVRNLKEISVPEELSARS